MLSILRYADELRDPKPYFEGINTKADPEAVGLAKELIEAESGRFEPQKIPDKYAETLRELLRAKVEQRAPQLATKGQGKARSRQHHGSAQAEYGVEGTREGAGCGAEANGQACKRARGKTESLTIEAKPTPGGTLDKEGPRSRGDHDRGSERNGEKNVAGCLLQGLRLDRLLVVPETTSHSDCNRNDYCDSKESAHVSPHHSLVLTYFSGFRLRVL